MNESLEKVRELAEPLARSLGLSLWGVEIVGSGKPCLRVYIDVPEEGEGSAALDQCEAVARDLGLALDVENIFPGAWVLEVSSPGLSRTFFSLEQMQPYIGDVVDVRLRSPCPPDSGQKVWLGVLDSVSGTSFTLHAVRILEDDSVETLSSEQITIPWSLVRHVHRHALFPKPPKPGKGGAQKRTDAS